MKELLDLEALKRCRQGERVSFKAKALRVWEIGGATMCLVGDERALTRIELGRLKAQPGQSYRFIDLEVCEYPGGWHSASTVSESSLIALNEDIATSQDEAYIERTFKILAGVQRKKARRERRASPWQHPASERGGTLREETRRPDRL